MSSDRGTTTDVWPDLGTNISFTGFPYKSIHILQHICKKYKTSWTKKKSRKTRVNNLICAIKILSKPNLWIGFHETDDKVACVAAQDQEVPLHRTRGKVAALLVKLPDNLPPKPDKLDQWSANIIVIRYYSLVYIMCYSSLIMKIFSFWIGIRIQNP